MQIPAYDRNAAVRAALSGASTVSRGNPSTTVELIKSAIAAGTLNASGTELALAMAMQAFATINDICQYLITENCVQCVDVTEGLLHPCKGFSGTQAGDLMAFVYNGSPLYLRDVHVDRLGVVTDFEVIDGNTYPKTTDLQHVNCRIDWAPDNSGTLRKTYPRVKCYLLRFPG